MTKIIIGILVGIAAVIIIVALAIKFKSYNTSLAESGRAFDPEKKTVFIPVSKQKKNLYDPFWLKKNSDNKYVKIYYEIIQELNSDKSEFIHIIKPYNKLAIRYYANNSLDPKTKLWKYQRHHIDEIKISGAIFSRMKEYRTSDAILVTAEEHFFLHYLIVMAQTTTPNAGILRQWESLEQGLEYWVEMARKYCLKYNLKYDNTFLDLIKLEHSMYKKVL
ncbi:hypothetical protein [Mycoplasma phocoeninasale]|uniref:hypothetical protein n=1 Tax=Mycoplasma phocoeninasale TaxID=2726117 RepID=UPI001968A466|nr:hypothetical protein [Mycoplasma phocoeninasale]MBN0970520.1 hypothetical protein [Mycoplasma phocoeninasale]